MKKIDLMEDRKSNEGKVREIKHNRRRTAKESLSSTKSLLMILLILALVIFSAGCSSSGGGYKDVLKSTQKYLLQTVPEPGCGSIGGEWVIIGMAQGDAGVPDDYYDNYLKAVESYVSQEGGVLHTVTGYKYTEYSRIILGVTAAGGNAENIAGYNFLERLTDMDNVCRQGINGPIWALIAFDSHCYEIPQLESVDEEKRTSREALIEAIIEGQLQDGGWDIMDSQADPDMTAMALQALAPYYMGDERFQGLISSDLLGRVSSSVDAGLEILSSIQCNDGGFESWGNASAESCAQVVVALSSLGIDCSSDTRFVKEGGSALEALLAYHKGDGGFSHIYDGESNQMATEQCCYALAAYDRFVNGSGRLYDMQQ